MITGSSVSLKRAHHCQNHVMTQISLCCVACPIAGSAFPQLSAQARAEPAPRASSLASVLGAGCCTHRDMAKWDLPALTCSELLKRTNDPGLISEEEQAVKHLTFRNTSPSSQRGLRTELGEVPGLPGGGGREDSKMRPSLL